SWVNNPYSGEQRLIQLRQFRVSAEATDASISPIALNLHQNSVAVCYWHCVPTCQRANVPTCQRANVPTCQHTNTPTRRLFDASSVKSPPIHQWAPDLTRVDQW